MKFLYWLRCHLLQSHTWTTDFIERGNVPAPHISKLSTSDEILKAFHEDNEMYCKHCGKDSEVSLHWSEKFKETFKRELQ